MIHIIKMGKDERRTSNVQHQILNKKNRTNSNNNYSIFVIDFSFSIGRSMFDVGRSI